MLKINSCHLFFLVLFFVNSSNTLCSSFTQRESDQNLPSFSLPSSSHNAYPRTNPSDLESNMSNNNVNFDSLLSDLFFASLRNTQQEATHSVATVSTEKLSDLAHTWHFNATLLSLLDAGNNTLPPTLHNTSHMSHVAAPMLHSGNASSTMPTSSNTHANNNKTPLRIPENLIPSNSIDISATTTSNPIPPAVPHIPLQELARMNEDEDHALPEKKKKKKGKKAKKKKKREKQPKKTFTCPTCHKNLASQQSLKYHLKTHNPNRKKFYQCPFCYRCFPAKNPLECHIRTHTGEKPFKCDFCNKRFKAKNNKTRHQRIHTGEKPFKCYICHKGLSSKVVFEEHLNKHLNKKPYKCEQCPKAYATKSGLKYHVKTHNRSKAYTCHYCGATFIHKSDYTSHMRYEESTDEDRKCHLCKKVYVAKYNLKRHNKRYHPEM